MIFADPSEYAYFIEQLGILVEVCGAKCYGWVLMPNHFHLLIMTGKIPISKLMSRLQTRYAVYFNRKNRRAGRLFQNRYKSILCDKDAYLKELIAYIHLNPLRAGLVKNTGDLLSYRWSGHRAMLGKEKIRWQETEEVLSQFGKTVGEARRNYLQYLQSRRGVKENYSGGGLIRSAGGWAVVMRRKRGEREMYDSRVLGGEDFVESVLRHADKEMQQTVRLQKSMDLDGLIRKIIDSRGVELGEIIKNGKTTDRGMGCRALITYLGTKYLNEPISDIAQRFQIGQPAGSRLYRKGEIMAGQQKDWIHRELDIVI